MTAIMHVAGRHMGISRCLPAKSPIESPVVVTVDITVNGVPHRASVPARTLLVHFLRENLRLTGTHVGCDTTQCGACTVHLDGEAVKSCTVLAAQASGHQVTTIEGLARPGQGIDHQITATGD